MPPAPSAPTVTVQHDQALAQRLGLSFADAEADLALAMTDDDLGLHVLRPPEHDLELGEGKPMVINLSAVDATSGHGRSLKQPIAKAVGLRKGEPHRPTVLDGTAGLGEDAALLAGLGCQVAAIEQHPVVFALLEDAAKRAGLPMDLKHANTLQALSQSTTEDQKPEIIYLDPMFPQPHARRAKQRKPMRLLAWLLTDWPATDEAQLLTAARTHASRRVVVKRPKHAPDYAGVTPAFRHTASAVRYDIYPAAQ